MKCKSGFSGGVPPCPPWIRACFENEKSSILAEHTEIFVFIIKTKSSSFLSSLAFPKFWKQNFIFFISKNIKYFGHNHVETGLNCSHELSIFLKYHMPLSFNVFSTTCVIRIITFKIVNKACALDLSMYFHHLEIPMKVVRQWPCTKFN